MTDQPKSYQITLFLSPHLDQKKIEEIVENIKKWITNKGGSISQETNPIKKSLAYPIKKLREVFCLNLNFLLPTEAFNEFYQYLNLEKEIIRYLITSQKPIKQTIDYKMIDKIEPLPQEPARGGSKEKVKIEELDKKLEEILNQ